MSQLRRKEDATQKHHRQYQSKTALVTNHALNVGIQLPLQKPIIAYHAQIKHTDYQKNKAKTMESVAHEL